MELTRRRFFGLTLAATATSALLGELALAPAASAFGPDVLYAGVLPPSDVPQKYGCLYPKTVCLQHQSNTALNGDLLVTFEQPADLPVFPVYRSANNGQTWTRISSVADTHNGIGNRCCAFLYELPQTIGSMAAGTILCAGISAPVDDAETLLELYKSTDGGSTWSWVSQIAAGGSYSTTAIWEPNLIVANDTLICYYSDSRDSAHSQKIVHQSSTDGVTWGAAVNDVALSPETLRPGMPVVSLLANGDYFMSYEVVNEASDTPTYFKISSDPESWTPTNIGTSLGTGGSPYNTVLPDGTILFNDYGSSNVFINTDNGSGSWTQVATNVAGGYSRTLQYVTGTGRVLIMSCPIMGSTLNTITYGDQDFGNSVGAYYNIVNRNSGLVLGVTGGSQANGAALIQWDGTGAEDQGWHVTTTSGVTKFGNRDSGQVIGIWQGSTTEGEAAVQWLDTGATNQQWTLTATSDGYYTITNVNSGMVLGVTGSSTAEGAAVIQWAGTGATDQQWELVEL